MTSQSEDRGTRPPDAADPRNSSRQGERAVEDRRRASRFPSGAHAMIHRKRRDPVTATVVNISTSGMLLHLDEPGSFQLDEPVTVEVEDPGHSEQAFSSWGIGIVVRVEPELSAIHLRAGIFDSHLHNGDR